MGSKDQITKFRMKTGQVAGLRCLRVISFIVHLIRTNISDFALNIINGIEKITALRTVGTSAVIPNHHHDNDQWEEAQNPIELEKAEPREYTEPQESDKRPLPRHNLFINKIIKVYTWV